jgi:hypothetical protein
MTRLLFTLLHLYVMYVTAMLVPQTTGYRVEIYDNK